MKHKITSRSCAKRVVVTVLAVICALSFTSILSASAATSTFKFTSRNSSKVSAIVTSSTKTSIVINPLKCREKKGNVVKIKKYTNSSGNTTSLYAGLTPDNGYKLVSNYNDDVLYYTVGSTLKVTVRYWY